MFEGKAHADEKAQHTWKYVSILKRLATQLSDIRWGFETTSKQSPRPCCISIATATKNQHKLNDQQR
jgi:hypothetical protein